MGAFIPYPAIGQHGLVGDRRTAALVSSDGTVDWLCLPDYDGHVVFGALLDAYRGGFWRVGPSTLWAGEQTYPGAAPFLRTRWATPDYELELLDAMLLPGERDERDRDTRVLIRRLTGLRGAVDCVSVFSPAVDFRGSSDDGVRLPDGRRCVHWCSDAALRGASGEKRIESGAVVWMVCAVGDETWDERKAADLLDEASRFWTRAHGAFDAERLQPRVVRSAMTIRMLEYAPCGSIVAAPTTSVPERVGGGWNADYRLTWVRDASLSIAVLTTMGDLQSPRRYFDWLLDLGSTTSAPLQVAYGIRGETRPRQHARRDLDGYRGSKPVRFGNHAYRQHQHDKFGYLADAALLYLKHGGEWSPRLWDLLARIADHVARHWDESGNGIWELAARQQYLSSRVMSWVALERVLEIAAHLAVEPPNANAWRQSAAAIRAQVEAKFWNPSLGAFQQSLECDALDASALLIPIAGFLPPSDPRVISTVRAVAERLTIDGCVYRFDPERVPKLGQAILGEYEGAFLPCTFWLAATFADMGRRRDAEDILHAAEAAAGPLGLFAEAIDPRSRAFLGNAPLLFSHVEYARAVRALSR